MCPTAASRASAPSNAAPSARGPSAGCGPAPYAAVRAEFARALGEAALLPFRGGRYLLGRAGHRSELALDLARAAPLPVDGELDEIPPRELSFFVACAERSGETHAVSFVRAMRAECARLRAPAPRFAGIGGERLLAEGVELLERPVDRAVMGFSGVLGSLSYYMRLLERCAERFRDAPPDVLVPVDSPALHVPLARIARRYGVPSAHFVAPQYWGWAPWRAAAYAKAVDRALTILPFEAPWFERRGVRAEHVGHPLLDHLAEVPATHPADDARAIVVLCGSRTSVVERNLPWMLARLARVDRELGHPPIVIAHDDAGQRARLDAIVARDGTGLDVRVAIGDLHAELARARTAFSVSGTVLLDVLHHRLPAVVVYRLAGRREAWLGRNFLTAPWFSATNLLANAAVLPEFAFAGAGPAEAVERALVRAHAHPAWRATCIAGLDRAAERLGPPGASRRAARIALGLVQRAGGEA